MRLSVPCDVAVTVTVTAAASHRCPFVDEADCGTVTVTWETGRGHTVELHALAELLSARAGDRISHEGWTRHVADTIGEAVALGSLTVTSRWQTGGLDVAVTAHRKPPKNDDACRVLLGSGAPS